MIIEKELLDDIQLTPLMDTLKLLKIGDEEYFGKGYNKYISNSRLSLLNPSILPPSRLLIISFNPSNAPPQINKIFSVLIGTNS